MCGRFAIGLITEPDWSDWLGLSVAADWPKAGWNVAPTQTVGILRRTDEGREIARARWGLVPHWWKKPLSEMKLATFNARAEEASKKPFFRDAWAHGRCLVPTIGYYEWTGPKGAKTPWFITRRRNTPGFCMAGLFARAEVDGAPLLSFTILTTMAGEATRQIHPRSPVVIEEPDWETWLSAATAGHELMRPIRDDQVEMWPVSRAVGNVRNDGPELIEPVEPTG